MKLQEVLNGLTILETNISPDLEITAVSYDSRKTKAGDLFVAVTGFEVDGHKFIPAALEKGAAAILCERRPEGDVPFVRVENTRSALAAVGANWFDHPSEKLHMVGVTGTNGKTSVTTILKTVLEEAIGAKVGLIGTIQNVIGDEVIPTERTTPESFELQGLLAQMVEKGCTHCIMEVSSHALVLNRVDRIAFEVGVFTNLTQDHLDFHKTMPAYAAAKAMLFSRCRHGVFNADDAYCSTMLQNATCTRLMVSAKEESDLCAKNIELGSTHIAMDVVYGGRSLPMRLDIPGLFTVYNSLSVIGAALRLGLPLEKILAALEKPKGVKGRVEVVPTPGQSFTVLIDYAHTPDALENVLKSVRGFCKGRLISVFGCGGDRDASKRPEMGEFGVRYSDIAIITSDNPRTEDPQKIIDAIIVGADKVNKPYEVVVNRRMAIRRAMDLAQENDIIVLCGKGHETYQIIGKEKTHLDEREEVASYLEEMNRK